MATAAPRRPGAPALPATMRAAVFEAGGKPLALRTVPRPEPAAGEVLVKVVACGMCHTDLHYMDHGTPTFKTPPLILGHEISGTVAKLGAGVDEAVLGTNVLLNTITSCGGCAMCRNGRENLCAKQKMLGNHVDGGYAEYVVAQARDAFAVPVGLPLPEMAVAADALTTAYHAVTRRAKLETGETLVVVGAGGLGLNVIQVAALVGARVIAVDIDARKLGAAREMGAGDTVDATAGDPVKAVRALTNGGADASLEAIGNPKTQEQALAMVRTGGRFIMLGSSPEPMSLAGGRVMFRELTVIGTLGCRSIDFPIVLDLVKRGRLTVAPLVTHRHPLEKINEGFDALRRGEGIRHIAVP